MSTNLLGKYLNTIEIPKNAEIINEGLKTIQHSNYVEEIKYKVNNTNKRSSVYLNRYYDVDLDDVEAVGEEIAVNIPRSINSNMMDKYTRWFVKGFCTINSFYNLDNFHEIFEEDVNTYERLDDCIIELEVIGGVVNGKSIIDKKVIEDFRNKGIYIVPVGFNAYGKIIKLDIYHEYIHNFDEEVFEYPPEVIACEDKLFLN